MKFISFSFDHSLFFILYALTSLLQMKMFDHFEYDPHILFMFLNSISLLFLVFLEDFSLILNLDLFEKDRITEPIQRNTYFSKQKITIIKAKQREQEKFLYYALSIVALGLLTALVYSLYFLAFICLLANFSGMVNILNNLVTWVILFFWSKSGIFRHYIFAFLIFLTAFLIFIFLGKDKFSTLIMYFGSTELVIGYFILTAIATSFKEVLEKYVLDVLFMPYSKLLFYEGVGSFGVTLFVLAVMQFIPCVETDDYILTMNAFCFRAKVKYFGFAVYQIFAYCDERTLYAWIYFLSSIFNDLFRILLNKKNGPTHRYSADLVAFALFVIYDIIYSYAIGQYQLYKWDAIVVLFLLIVGCLIYNENIRIHFFNLSYYTRYEIERRAVTDSKLNDSTLIQLEEIEELNHTVMTTDNFIS